MIWTPPFTKLDFLSCRNLMIYLTAEMQKKLIPLFHYSLRPGGILFLGSAETVGSFTDLFEVVDCKARLYRRTESVATLEPLDFPSAFTRRLPAGSEPPAEIKSSNSLQVLADRLVLDHYASPAVLVNDKGNILYVSGRTWTVWNRPPEKPIGTSLPWPVKACATNSRRPSRKRSDRKSPWCLRICASRVARGNISPISPFSAW